MTQLTILVTLCVITATSVHGFAITDEKQTNVNSYRLPTIVNPSNYVIEITPYFEAESVKLPFTYDGNVQITLRASENTSKIVLHCEQLEINAALTKLNEAIDVNTIIRIVNTTYVNATQQYTLNLESALRTTVDYVLSFTFVGKINSDMYGFYASYYEENGTIKLLGTTQMEPTSARRVFPCFDEPHFKATFNIRINRQDSFEPCISNTKLENTQLNVGPRRVRDIFKRTPIMSTYLVAFVVSHFKSRENVAKTFGIYARPDAYTQTEYSFNFGQRALSKFDEWLDYRYSSVPEMEKMHMAAIPDFSPGAMENWGLLTYKENALLFEADSTNALAQQRIATTIVHEQAHMWFGNLVTCDWWNYLWLNEGFARYFQYFLTHMIEPNWQVDLQFNVEQLHSAFLTDSLESTHPLTQNVSTSAEIQAMFDNISYNKGAAILRMIEHLIGTTNFQTALQEYLKSNAFKTATPEKLYAALQHHAGDNFNIAVIMSTWTTQSGYPVVTVEVQQNRSEISITQKRFLLKNKNHNDQTKWEIPLNYAEHIDGNFVNTQSFFTLSRNQDEPLKLELKNEIDWIIFNVQQTGFYRVNYDVITWTNIAKALHSSEHSKIHVLNRAQIVDDVLNLARGGLVDYKIALNVIQYLDDEENYLPWLAALNNWEYISRRFDNEQLVVAKKYILQLIEKISAKLGFEERTQDSRLDIYNRMNIMSYACKYGHKDCIVKSVEEFAKFETTTYIVPVNIRSAVYCTAIAEGSDEEWRFLWNKFKTENVATEKSTILNALGCTKNENLINEYIEHILSDDIRMQDKLQAFNTIYSQPENVQIILDYIVNNHRLMSESLGGIGNVAKIIAGIATRLTTEQQIQQIENLYNQSQQEFSLVAETVSSAINEAKFNINWSKENIPIIYDHMKTVVGSAGHITLSFCLLITSILLIKLI